MCATFNFGPSTVSFIHTDPGNLPYGWCPITSLGPFDPKCGGHLILWDLQLVIKFPPGGAVLKGRTRWLLVEPIYKQDLSTVKGCRGISRGQSRAKQGVYDGKRVRYMHGKAYLSMDVATESEVADTEGSTASGAPL